MSDHASFVSLDLEATGKHPARARMVQAAVVGFTHHSTSWILTTRNHTRVDPGVPIPPDSTAVHGFRDGDVAASIPTAAALRWLWPLLRGQIVVGYNLAAYDLELIRNEAERCGCLDHFRATLATVKVVDLFQWVQATAPRQRKRESGALSLAAQVADREIAQWVAARGATERRRPHDASYDAEAAGWLCCRMLDAGQLPGLEEAAAATAGTWGHLLR